MKTKTTATELNCRLEQLTGKRVYGTSRLALQILVDRAEQALNDKVASSNAAN